VEVVSEANSFAQGWGQVIFPTANEMLANEKIRATYERTAETRAELEAKYDVKPKITPNTTSSKPANGLLSAPHPSSEGIPSSDGEGSTGSGTPKLGKKGKKRR